MTDFTPSVIVSRTFRSASWAATWAGTAAKQRSAKMQRACRRVIPLLWFGIALAHAQQRFPDPPPLLTGTASIHGRVVDALSGQPIEGAEVRLVDDTIETETKEVRGRTVTVRQFMRSGKTLSGSDGQYGFDSIRDGVYRLHITHRLYLPACRGPALVRAQCDVITVVTDQRLDDANISLS